MDEYNVLNRITLRSIIQTVGKLFPLFTSIIIIGSIDIVVSGSENLYEVEFYIDDEYTHADISDPYTYSWNEKTSGKHKITFSCNGERDSVVNKDIFVWKFS